MLVPARSQAIHEASSLDLSFPLNHLENLHPSRNHKRAPPVGHADAIRSDWQTQKRDVTWTVLARWKGMDEICSATVTAPLRHGQSARDQLQAKAQVWVFGSPGMAGFVRSRHNCGPGLKWI